MKLPRAEESFFIGSCVNFATHRQWLKTSESNNWQDTTASEAANVFINTPQQLKFASIHHYGSWNDSFIFNDMIRYLVLWLTLNTSKKTVCLYSDGNIFICKWLMLFFPVPFGTKPVMTSIVNTLMYLQQSSSAL